MRPSSFTSERLVGYLRDVNAAAPWLKTLGITDNQSAHRRLVAISDAELPLDLLATLCSHLTELLPSSSNADMALANLSEFVLRSRSPLSILALFERDQAALPILIQIFSSSQIQSNTLLREPEHFDLLRLTDGEPVPRRVLVEELVSEIHSTQDLQLAANMLARFKERELLRVAYGDLIKNQGIDTVARQITYVAEAVLEASVAAVGQQLRGRHGSPHGTGGSVSRFVVVGLGELGGRELNYSSDIKLFFVYEADGETDGDKPIANRDYFAQLGRGVVDLLTRKDGLDGLYRVDPRMRPDGEDGSLVVSADQALRHYDVNGRTWERQMLVKARPTAGDLEFGSQWLNELEAWTYRRYLTRAEIDSIKALKRRLEHRSIQEGMDDQDIRHGSGGIRAIEFAIEFLQLLNGGDAPEIRVNNTLEAMSRLARMGCLTHQEHGILEKNYRFLQRIEHRMQVMLDTDSHMLPQNDGELTRLAARVGVTRDEPSQAREDFRAAIGKAQILNRKILDHLLGDAFAGEQEVPPEVDLVLAPTIDADTIHTVLAPYGFDDPGRAYKHLLELAEEPIPFLSDSRCRHFLAAIAHRLLETIAHTPNADETLDIMSRVSNSLGGKSALWELLSSSQPLLRMYVRLCSSSPYLSGILVANPGMVDDLMDSLLLDRLSDLPSLRARLADLCQGAVDLDLIFHGFKSAQHLRVGIRDLVGKDDGKSLMVSLSDIAESIVCQGASEEYRSLVDKYGTPMRDPAAATLEPVEPGEVMDGDTADRGRMFHNIGIPSVVGAEGHCAFVILCRGKFGGHELSYHSDIDIAFVYDTEGLTQHTGRGRDRKKTTTNRHFFSELARRVSKTLNHRGSSGRLYVASCNWRETDGSECDAVSLARFSDYFRGDEASLQDYLSLSSARPIFGPAELCRPVMAALRRAFQQRSNRQDFGNLQQLRAEMESTATTGNLKRGSGGHVDIEMIASFLQLRHACDLDELPASTIETLDRLAGDGLLSRDDAEALSDTYTFVRRVESRLGLMSLKATHEIPQDPKSLDQLAYLSGWEDGAALAARCQQAAQLTRRLFDKLLTPALA